MWIICLDPVSANSEKAARSVLVDYREGLTIRMAGYKLCSIDKMACSWIS